MNSALSTYASYLTRFFRDAETGALRIGAGARAFARIGALYFLRGRRVRAANYAREYDAVAPTYDRWLELMARHTDALLNLAEPRSTREHLELLDLACGTGYITRQLLARLTEAGFSEFSITAVEISSGMLARCQAAIDDGRVRFVCAEGLEHLRHAAAQSLDDVYLGWALPYFQRGALIPALRRVLRPGGRVHVIANCRGTLGDIEDIFVDLCAEHPGEVARVLDIGAQLPDGDEGLAAWFEAEGLQALGTGHGEEIVRFDDPGSLYRWLRETGALAGVGELFREQGKMERHIVDKLDRRRRTGSGWTVNHRFAFGVFERRP